MHSGTTTAGISDKFPIFLILMLDSRNEPIHITKWEINGKSIAYFKTLLSVVNCKHVLNESSPNNAHNEFLKIFWVFTMRQAFPWITKSLVKSSKKKQRLYVIYFEE